MESKYVEHSYNSVERNSNLLELIHTDMCDMKLTPSHGGKKYLHRHEYLVKRHLLCFWKNNIWTILSLLNPMKLCLWVVL